MTPDPFFEGLPGLTGTFSTMLADPPWRFANRTGKMAPEHKRLHRYQTLTLEEIKALPVGVHARTPSHLYLWVPNALLACGLEVLAAWGFTYKTNLVWCKVRKDGGPDGRGVGFYFRNVTEMLLFGVKGHLRTLDPARKQVNVLLTRKREHSRKPEEIYPLIEACSPGPYLELFARDRIAGWAQWGDQVDSYQAPDYPPYTGPQGKGRREWRGDETAPADIAGKQGERDNGAVGGASPRTNRPRRR